MSKSWIQTLSSRKLDPLALTPAMVGGIEEIAHALAGNYRFTRQTRERYSVAEHCVRGSRLIAPEFAGAFLLHELSEVYLPDVASPLKPSLKIEETHVTERGLVTTHTPWAQLEKQHTRVILEALGLAHVEPLIYSPEVHTMDLAMLSAEKRDLCGPSPEPWGKLPEPATSQRIEPWTLLYAERSFVQEFHFLFPRARK